jgi:hypothetical protein
MTTTRTARTLRCVSIVATAAMSLLALQTSAWGQPTEKPTATVAAPQTPAPAATVAAPQTPAPAAQPAEAAPVQTPPAEVAPPIPPPPSDQQAIPAPPPGSYSSPGYGPPPGRPYHYYYNQPGYSPYNLAPLRPVTYRPFMFGVGLGMGSLTYSASDVTKHEAALSYSLRLGFSITARWMAMLAMDGSWGQFTFNDRSVAPANSKLSIAVTSYTAGGQFFILRWLYARLGLGLACLEWSDDWGDYSDCHGQTAVGAVGVEFQQTQSTAVGAELGGFVSRFPDAKTVNDRNDIWYHIGVNLVLNLF